MPTSAASILASLNTVEAERAQRSNAPDLASKVTALKAYQQRRFLHTYDDLLQSARYAPAARFFLQELYGPADFSRRDAQFARVVPALVRLFPREIVDTVATLAQLHALSETLDTSMAHCLDHTAVDATGYIQAWQQTARPEDRRAQISLTLDVARRLDHLTRRALVRNSLWLMRGPARAAGLTEMQRFLEAGFDTFQKMKGAQDFVAMVAAREEALAASMFAARFNKVNDPQAGRALSLLP